MTGSVLTLTLAYVAVAALLLSLTLATRYPVWVKGLAILLVSGLYFGTWLGYQGLLGWPSNQPMPSEFRVLWISIEDPDKGSSEPGHIYYWLRALDESGAVSGPPRAHAVPWDEATAEEAQRALDELEEGEVLNGRRTRGVLNASEPPPQVADLEAGVRSIPGAEDREVDFKFYSVPPPSLPAKDSPPFPD
ncbi:MAG: hypothetical protein CMN75_15040 [Spirochaeta sp.]|nr:hypothetical protein [Spirochaeta sp.]RPG12494.1 MAG: hypothetical protein CBC32_003520 [Proteobacteria bacterium TMED72]